jgi:phosphoglycolate phosphatase
MYRYFIFDFDGTVANSGTLVEQIIGKLAADNKVKMISAKEFIHREGLSILKKLQLFLFIRRVSGAVKDMYTQHLASILPFAGMLELLVAVHDAGFPLVFITSNIEGNIREFFRINRFAPPVTVLSSEGLFGKDKAIRSFLRQYQCAKEDVLYIGDEIRDIKACRKAGIDIAFVEWGLDGAEDLGGLRPKFKVKSPTKLRDILMKTGYTG